MVSFADIMKEMLKSQYDIDKNNININKEQLTNIIDTSVKEISKYKKFFNIYINFSIFNFSILNIVEYKQKIVDTWSLILSLTNLELEDYIKNTDKTTFAKEIKKYFDENENFNILFFSLVENNFYFDELCDLYMKKK